MVENETQIKSRKTINVGVRESKNVICAKKVVFGILVLMKMVNI